MKRFLGCLLLLSAIGLGGLVIMSEIPLIMKALLLLAAVDLVSTVFGKPLIKPGPIAKFLYPNLKEDESAVNH